MTERTVKVKYGDQRRRMRLTLESFGDFQENIRRRFDLGTEKMSVKAILDGDEDAYDVTNDGDLQDLWNDLVELRITTIGIKPQIEIRLELKRVEIDGAQYRLDVPMAENSLIVQHYIDQNHLGDFINETKAIATVVGRSYIAVAASGDSKLIFGMGDICFLTRGICDKTRRLMLEYERTSSHILETFQHMILYTNQNQHDDAVMAYTTVDEFVKQSCDDTSKLIEDIEPIMVQMKVFTEQIAGDGETIQEKLKEDTEKMKKVEKDLKLGEIKKSKIEGAIDETHRLEGVRKEKDVKVGKNATVAAKVAKTGAVGALVAGAVARVAGVAEARIAAPIFLLAGIGGAIACGVCIVKKIQIDKEGEKNLEQIQLRKGEKIEVEQDKIELNARLEELSRGIEPGKNLKCCLQAASHYITKMKYALQGFKTDWQGIADTCGAMQKLHQTMKDRVDTEDCSKLFESDGFKLEIVRYYARWVAMKVFAKRCNESLKASAKELEETIHTR